MTNINAYTVGDRITVRAYLYLNGVPDPDLPTATKVEAAITTTSETGRALATGTAVVTATVIDAPTGLVEAVWPSSQTGNIAPGRYFVEFKATVGGQPVTYERPEIMIEDGAF
jgi:hypothetical protein